MPKDIETALIRSSEKNSTTVRICRTTASPLHKMAQVVWRTTLMIVWLLFTTTGLADKPPSASIDFTLGTKGQHLHRKDRESGYGIDVPVYGPLVPSRTHNRSEMLRRADPPGFPGVDLYGPLLNVPGCFFCPEQEVTAKTGRDLLAELTTAKMQSYMRARQRDLVNKCVFYSAAVRQPPRYLSDETSVWACSKRKFSIWVSRQHIAVTDMDTSLTACKHLWPNKRMTEQPRYKDFYGITETDNWLHSIMGMPLIPADRNVPTMIQYFENMSEAMARSCSGEVVVVSQTPDDMARYLATENIWKNKERPALLNLQAQGKISRFLVVDYDNRDDIWEFDLANNQRGNKVPPADLLSRRQLEEETEGFRLMHRDACDSTGLAQRPPQGDPFADDYSNFR
ncbi:hypothetical protein CONLIGDRAFT_222956 [Coniochaeta ligniaria NRRL 30616]|uniref:Uncharacterized protein n=1 Tax=Coniochaeta ligniaria NRRL 30616 TaxID=1408157 RepID=A0A1J7IXT7_9PEZI|nr:hypothetical protein CONLIGDRAFT_222956 [Coniochaeta ligniaria NRRL 30616]